MPQNRDGYVGTRAPSSPPQPSSHVSYLRVAPSSIKLPKSNMCDSWLHPLPCPPFPIHLKSTWSRLLNPLDLPTSSSLHHPFKLSRLLASLWFSSNCFKTKGSTVMTFRTLPSCSYWMPNNVYKVFYGPRLAFLSSLVSYHISPSLNVAAMLHPFCSSLNSS